MGTLARELALRYSKTMTLNDYVDFETLEEWILKELELMRQRGETTNKGTGVRQSIKVCSELLRKRRQRPKAKNDESRKRKPHNLGCLLLRPGRISRFKFKSKKCKTQAGS